MLDEMMSIYAEEDDLCGAYQNYTGGGRSGAWSRRSDRRYTV
jgi:hypothetical protein